MLYSPVKLWETAWQLNLENEILTAPADGTVTVVMEESNHACGLRFSNGMEILLHIGLDTVDMNGDGFEPLVKTGDVVKAGDPLIKFSKEKSRCCRAQRHYNHGNYRNGTV